MKFPFYDSSNRTTSLSAAAIQMWSCVMYQMSNVYSFISLLIEWWSYLWKGLLSKGLPGLVYFKKTNKKAQDDLSFLLMPTGSLSLPVMLLESISLRVFILNNYFPSEPSFLFIATILMYLFSFMAIIFMYLFSFRANIFQLNFCLDTK